MMLSLKVMLQNCVKYLKDELEVARREEPEEEHDDISDEMVAQILDLSSLPELCDYLMGLADKGVYFWDFSESEAWEFIAYSQLDMEKTDEPMKLENLELGNVVMVNDDVHGNVFGVVTLFDHGYVFVTWDNSGNQTVLHEGMYELVTTVHQQAVRLQKLLIVGNAYDDHNLLHLAHEIIVSSEASYDQKIAALKRIDEAMGCESEYSQAAIDYYIAETVGDEVEQANFPTPDSVIKSALDDRGPTISDLLGDVDDVPSYDDRQFDH